MNTTTIIKKGKDLVWWIYKTITGKFTSLFQKLKDIFPAIEKYPMLRYSLIPILIALFFVFRYVVKIGINELATCTSSYLGETTAYSISEKSIVLFIAVLFVSVRIFLKLRGSKKNKDNKSNVVLKGIK